MARKDKEMGREYDRRWYGANSERKKEYMKRLNEEKPWVRHYRNTRSRCTNPNFSKWKHYGGRGIRMFLTVLEVELLYKRDGAEHMERPSIDRINSNSDYHFGNCRFIEMDENRRRQARQ